MNVPLKNDKYIFNHTAKTITFVGLSGLFLQSIYAIFNVTDGIQIYDFGDPTKTGTLTGSILTLTYDTSSMSDTDSLLIKYDDGILLGIDLAEKVQDESVPLLRRIVKLLEVSANGDIANRQRIVLDAITGALTLTTVTTVGTVSAVTNIAAIAGLDQRQFADTARISYNTGIRDKLIFT
jgi:hypothetical protein